MSDHYHHISPFRPHLRDIFARGFGNVVDRHFTAEIGFIPGHDLRRHKADIADAQGVGLTVAVHDPGILDQVRRKHRFSGFGIDDIGVHVGELRPGQRLVQEVETVIELMVAQVADGVIQGVHRLIYRMYALFEPFCRHIVA